MKIKPKVALTNFGISVECISKEPIHVTKNTIRTRHIWRKTLSDVGKMKEKPVFRGITKDREQQ